MEKIFIEEEVRFHDFTLGIVGVTEFSKKAIRVLYQLDLYDRDYGDVYGIIIPALTQLGYVVVYSDVDVENSQLFLFYEDLKSPVRNTKGLLFTRLRKIYTQHESIHRDLLIEEEAYYDCMFQDLDRY